MSLVRMAKEDQLVAWDAEDNPPTLDALLNGQGRIGSGNLSLAAMAERASSRTKEPWKEAWEKDYGTLSEYGVHTRLKGLRSLVAIGPDGRIVLRPGGQYDRVRVDIALYHTLLALEWILITVKQLTGLAKLDWIAGASPTLDEVDALWRRILARLADELREPADGCDQIPDKPVEGI